ncbi:molybdopterin biosynthesis protein MoeB [Listeria newyorkensis]|uniref:Molybdopterin biosynthesis protein MoeB n=1 Tax=Listeria newyorkensis TaxID=1497681 RepID=A0ABX4XM78_9LIST|nr:MULTISPECIES: ThiF family adenylyltransferase [Listeria]KGL37704.1 molybdopterin biosynthesis protein MoeB [Listeriaceae bacterium FSL A5-0209]KGL44428.1 molybdopterin biosynthesis protein MoeB [Listeria newyorkensis]KMT62808.1 molybdopterin biosynthesis protein [Listeria newyorkensis]PNP92285.1 molybdopterin biosynthesis protein MoeB [Listeria newyorkensis]RQW66872.1 molybdopterin biosynthesis protein MoeB [Listeria sp. SHR_NRA_18]
MERYDRQMRVAQIGRSGQESLQASTVLIVGVGAIGTYAAEIAARMGIGRLILVDRDFVELSNLQRQTLFTEQDATQKEAKAWAAAKALRAINRDIMIDFLVDDANGSSLLPFVGDIDAVLDCTDNFATRRFLNEWCLEQRVPWIFASCAGTFANLMPIIPGETACLHCLMEKMPLFNETSCDIIGVHGALIPMLAGLQVSLLTKLLLGERSANYYQLDNWEMTFQKFGVSRNPDCAVCVRREKSEVAFSKQPVLLCGRDTVQFQIGTAIDFNAFKTVLGNQDISCSANRFVLTFTFRDYDFTVFQNGRVLVHGTDDLMVAKKQYQHFFNEI